MASDDIELVLKIKSPLGGNEEYIVDLSRVNDADTGNGCLIAPYWEHNQVTFSQMLQFFCNGGDILVIEQRQLQVLFRLIHPLCTDHVSLEVSSFVRASY